MSRTKFHVVCDRRVVDTDEPRQRAPERWASGERDGASGGGGGGVSRALKETTRAQVNLGLEDLRPQGAVWQVRLHENGGHAARRAVTPSPRRCAPTSKGFLFRASPGHNVTVLTEQPMKVAGKRLRIAPFNAWRGRSGQ